MRTAVIAIACASCGGHRAPEPLANPSTGCTVRDSDIKSLGTIQIARDGAAFARLSGRFNELEATFTEARRSIRAATENVILTGELAAWAQVRPRERKLVDGWLYIDEGRATEVVGSSLRLTVELPHGLDPRETSTLQPCAGLTFASARPPRTEGTELEFAPGSTTELRATPAGKVVARIAPPKPPAVRDPDVPPDDDVVAIELESRADWKRVRLTAPNAVEGWIPAKAAHERTDVDVYGGLIGDEAGETGALHLVCEVAVPIYVRSRGAKVRVGAIVPRGRIPLGAAAEAGTIALDLGETALVPFVDQADAGECRRVQ